MPAHDADARSGAARLRALRFWSHLHLRGHLSVTSILHGAVPGQSHLLLTLPGTRHTETL